jgi:hypothetical protein
MFRTELLAALAALLLLAGPAAAQSPPDAPQATACRDAP